MGDVMIGMITAGTVDIGCCESLLASVAVGAVGAVRLEANGPYLDIGRNRVMEAFLYHEEYQHCDNLLFVDSDITFHPDGIKTLVDDQLPIVSGVYYSLFHDGKIRPVVYETVRTEDKPLRMKPIDNWGAHPEEEHLVKVEAVGAGFLMIHRSVAADFTRHYSGSQIWFGIDHREGSQLGEDLSFCMRAGDHGIPIVVDRRVQVAHAKGIILNGPYKDAIPYTDQAPADPL